MIALIHVYLLVMIIACFWKIISIGDGWNESTGIELFMFLSTIVFSCSAVCVILYSGVRIIFDRVTQDQMFYSGLYPYQIMIGKILTGAVITALFFCMTFPFVVLSYLLRGVDIIVATGLYLFFFVLIQQLNVVCIAFCAGVRSLVQGIGFGILLVAYLILGTAIAIGMAVSLIAASSSSFGATWAVGMLFGMFFFLLMAMVPTMIAFFIGIARLNPVSYNSMFVIRILATILGVTTFVPAFLGGIVDNYSGGWPFVLWLGFMVPCVSIMMIVGTCERETWEARVRMKIPSSREYRSLAYVFFTGSPNAMLWGIGWIVIGLLAGGLMIVRQLIPNVGGVDLSTPILSLLASLILMYAYCMSAILIWNRFFSKWIPKDATWLLVIGLLVAVCLGGSVFFFLVSPGGINARDFDGIMILALFTNLPNPFGWMFMMDYYSYGNNSVIQIFSICQLTFALLWGAAVTGKALPWFKECYENFSPLEDEDLRPRPPRAPVTAVKAAFRLEKSAVQANNVTSVERMLNEAPPPSIQIYEKAEIVEEESLPTLGAFWNEEDESEKNI